MAGQGHFGVRAYIPSLIAPVALPAGYAAKNGLSVQIDPALAGAYNLPAGKQAFISNQLRREASRRSEAP